MGYGGGKTPFLFSVTKTSSISGFMKFLEVDPLADGWLVLKSLTKLFLFSLTYLYFFLSISSIFISLYALSIKVAKSLGFSLYHNIVVWMNYPIRGITKLLHVISQIFRFSLLNIQKCTIICLPPDQVTKGLTELPFEDLKTINASFCKLFVPVYRIPFWGFAKHPTHKSCRSIKSSMFVTNLWIWSSRFDNLLYSWSLGLTLFFGNFLPRDGG